MATFKVGQMVCVVATYDIKPVPQHVGKTGQIIGTEVVGVWDCRVKLDRGGSDLFYFCELAPLTDPKADEFIERIKKLEPLKQPEYILK